jgi:glycosyltransferase involved in cell wall biosynthesis
LGSGGAQRQMVTLAIGLKKRGHNIRFLVYHTDDHFLPLLLKENISFQVIENCSYIRRAWKVRRILRDDWQDVVLAFMESPSLYSELARFPYSKWGLVVGERLAYPRMKRGMSIIYRQFHRLADSVVCNSYTNKLMLERAYYFLRNKNCTVYNIVDLRLFNPDKKISNIAAASGRLEFRIVVAASYQEKKNMINVAKAVLILKNNNLSQSIVIDWFGAMPSGPAAFTNANKFIIDNGLSNNIRLHSVTKSIESEYYKADAIGLFSFYEGLPNVICEGMACGKPILMSNVCDAGNLVQDGINGFLFDPDSPEDIAQNILKMAMLSYEDLNRMGVQSRILAEQLFSEDIIAGFYERILELAVNKTKLPIDCNWPNGVPDSAYMTVKKWNNC